MSGNCVSHSSICVVNSDLLKTKVFKAKNQGI